MISKKKYFDQVEKLVNSNYSLNIEDFNKLYEIASNLSENIDGIELANRILTNLFEVPVYKDLLIPLGFLESEIGKAIIQVKFGVQDDSVYLTEDVARISGFTPTYIGREASSGKIKGEQRGKIWVFKKKDVEEYLKEKSIGTKADIKYETKQEEIKNLGFERENSYK